MHCPGYNSIICRYSEIAIKGGNRRRFEAILVDNLYHLLRKVDDIKISRVRGRIFIKHSDGRDFTEDELTIVQQQLQRAFGLETFSPVIMTEVDLDKIRAIVKDCVPEIFGARLSRTEKNVSFRVRVRRADKSFPLSSKDVEIELATLIDDSLHCPRNLVINLSEQADITIFCEIREEFAFVFFERFPGPGGLPAGSNGKVLALLSGGIDSPVACYLLMKRGCSVNYITFHSEPYTPPETIDKVKKLRSVLNLHQKHGKLFICNMLEIQKMIRDNCNERYRTVLYRRMMFRIAEKVAKANNCQALLTGEAVGQVASQTLVNMGTIEKPIDMLIVRPLSGMDKLDIIRLAEKIGTFDISKVQCPDSCTVFAPQSPSTSVPPVKAAREEQVLADFETILDEIVDQTEVFNE